MSILKHPLLAPKDSLNLEIFKDYPIYSSPKLDGIRCMILDSKPRSRTLKPIPNKHIVGVLERLHLPDGFDGEILTYSDVEGVRKVDSYNILQSKVMTQAGIPDFEYHVFDWASNNIFKIRYNNLETWFDTANSLDSVNVQWIFLVEHILCKDKVEIDIQEDYVIQEGFEGLMLKNPNAYYKQGRATYNEGIIYKLKKFEDSEAKVLEVREAYENTNPKDEDEFGKTKRSKSQEGMVAKGCMGKLLVRDICHPEWPPFEIGTGFSARDRDWWWSKKESLSLDSIKMGSHILIKYKFQRHGMKDVPRIPVYLGLRNQQID